jgi:hypothetical protein
MGCDSEMAKNPSGVKEGKIQESNDRLDGNRGEILLGKLQMEQNSPKPRESKQRERERESPQSLREETLQLYHQIHMSNLIRGEESSSPGSSARTPISSRISWTLLQEESWRSRNVSAI